MAQRASLLERVSSVRRAALIREHESETIAGWLSAARTAKAREVEKVFAAELSALPEESRADRDGGDGGRRGVAGVGELPDPPGAGRRAGRAGDAHDPVGTGPTPLAPRSTRKARRLDLADFWLLCNHWTGR